MILWTYLKGEFEGGSLGNLTKISNPMRFGFSEPPARPVSVLVRSIIKKN